jgi:aspartyl-tRNA(Asn)/glutamyl-tRNA(Gln) amidotransferase subunit A
LATPTVPRPPDAFDTLDPNEQNLRPSFTNPFNLTGLPALSVPCGFTEEKLPVGLQIAAPAFDEAVCFRAAYAYEQATEWHKLQPPA